MASSERSLFAFKILYVIFNTRDSVDEMQATNVIAAHTNQRLQRLHRRA